MEVYLMKFVIGLTFLFFATKEFSLVKGKVMVFSICGRWENGVVVAARENVFYDPEDKIPTWMFESVQYLNIPVHPQRNGG